MKRRFCDSRGSISISTKPARPSSSVEQLCICLQYPVQQALQHLLCSLHGWSFLCWVNAWTECKVASSAIKWPARLSIRKTSLSIKTPETSGLVRKSFFPFLLVPRWPGLALPRPALARLFVSFPLHPTEALTLSSPEAVTCDISFSFTRTPKHSLHDDKGHSNQHS